MDGLDSLVQQSHRCSTNQDDQDHSADPTGECKSEFYMNSSFAHKNCFNEQQPNEQQHEQLMNNPSTNDVNLRYASRFNEVSSAASVDATEEHQGHQQHLGEHIDYITTSADDENHFQQAGHYEQQNLESRLDCGIDTRMSDDDAFIAFCADSSSVLNSDPNRRYYINKLYQPLNTGASTQNQSRNNQNLDCDSQYPEQDDDYLLYQDFKFIESNAQKTSVGHSRTELSKILEDDDGDEETTLGKDPDDSLDCLQLTTIIESFDDFASSPLIDSCNGNDLLISPSYSQVPTNVTNNQQNSNEHLKERASSINNHEMHKINFVPTVSYNSSGDHYNPVNSVENHRHQEMFNQDYTEQSGTSYPSATQGIHSHDQNVPNEGLTCEQVFQSHGQHPNRHQEMRDCVQLDSTAVPVDQTKVSSVGSPIEETTNKKDDSNAEINDTRKKRPSDDEAQTRRTLNKRLKKKRSTSSIAEKKSKRMIAVDASTNLNTINDEVERIQALRNPSQNDEDESIVSDNNSMRSDSSRRNPIVNHYRRRTANARERIRMREINQAFEKLKKVVPIELVQQAALESGEISDQATSTGGGRRKSSPSSGPGHQADSVKLTKITTLRLAVSYIAKLTEILNENPDPSLSSNTTAADSQGATIVCNQKKADGQAKEISVKTTRRSRSVSKRSSQDKGKKLTTKSNKVKVDSSFQEIENKEKMVELQIDNQVNNQNQVISNERPQQPLIISNSLFNKASNQHPQQTAFISIPSQQKQQYLTTYPNQQQLLISQPIGNGQERTLVTPVAVAILGIPTTNTNNQQATSTNELTASQNIQLVGIQKPNQQTIIGQQQPAYNLQLAQTQQPQQQYLPCRQPQQVTLTLDDMNGLSVLRLANPQISNQSMPIQFRTIQTKQNHTFMQQAPQQQRQAQFFTQNGVNYAFQPIQTQHTNTSITTTQSPTPTNFQQSMIRICNNQPDNLTSQNSNNIINNNSNNINSASNDYLRQKQTESNQQAICNISQMGFLPSQLNHATFTTGTNSDQVSNITISSKDATAVTQQRFENNQIQISQQPVNNVQQQQQLQQQQQQSNCITPKTVFIPTSNFMTFSTSNQLIQARPVSLQTQNTFAGDVQIGQSKTANLVYINPLSQSGGSHSQAHQRVCILTDQIQGSQVQTKHAQSNDQHQDQEQRMNDRGQTPIRSMSRDKLGYITHFNAQSDQSQNSANETNITQLVASLATSIQPQNSNVRTAAITNNSVSSATDNFQQKPQQLPAQQQQQQQQQPVRTYRFHNYDGNMINSHLYGNNNQTQQQQPGASKRVHLSKQQRENADKIAEPQTAAPKQRSRQNSLSSICSTTSCSSSSLNYTSSTGGSPSNNVPVVSIVVSSSPVECNSNRSMTNNSPPMIEDGLLKTTSMQRSARIAT